MIKSISSKIIGWGVIFLFIVLNSFLIRQEFLYYSLASFGVLVVVVAIFRLDIILKMTIFAVPLSVPLRAVMPGVSNDIYVPSEMFMVGLTVVFLMKLAYDKEFDYSIKRHLITKAIIIYLGWMLLTSLTSTMPVVSIKFWLSRSWYIIVFYFLCALYFNSKQRIYEYMWLYIIPMLITVGYTFNRHASYGFNNQKAAHWSSYPFFNDHTEYGAIIVMLLPVIMAMIATKKYKGFVKAGLIVSVLALVIALILSYGRAAWLSSAAILGCYFIFKWKINTKFIIGSTLTIGFILLISWSSLMNKLQQNRSDSSDHMLEHVQSMTNITTDASNLERINRWSCAVRMFEQKPYFGWGPGTYSFQYAPFQLSKHKTIISTNNGDGGNAHSEYLGAMVDSGFLGTICFLLIMVVSLRTAVQLHNRLQDKEMKTLVLGFTLGLISYYINGLINNFLDTDNAACLFWGYIAFIAVLDQKYPKDKKIRVKTPFTNTLLLHLFRPFLRPRS